jgi:hypothetical protein
MQKNRQKPESGAFSAGAPGVLPAAKNKNRAGTQNPRLHPGFIRFYFSIQHQSAP